MEFRPWKIAVPKRTDAAPGGRPGFLRAVLEARGIAEEAGQAFLDGGYQPYDPFLLTDMDRAVERVRRALDHREKILVYGDYDCDGITATVLLYDYLDNAGADVLYYIPERAEGYGLSRDAVDRVKAAGVGLIVTVDNGISAVDEVAYAASLGVDVVITDHHRPGPVLPEAAAVVDPHREGCAYPFKDLCGVGVAFKLIGALEGDAEGMLLEHYGDIVALGTLADVVPLLDENRALVKAGLALMAETQNLGLLALAGEAGLDLAAADSEKVVFGLAPRINVAGRIGSVDQAVELLLCQDEARAKELAAAICALNDRRKELEGEVLRDIQGLLEREPELLCRRVLVLSGVGWNRGVVGIIASRLVERYGKPCVLLSVEGGEARGSARSVEGFSIIDAVRSCAALLTRHGGHPMAAGFSLDAANLEAFDRGLQSYAAQNHPQMPVATLGVDTVLRAGEITLDNVRLLEGLEPFGCGNPQPVFALLGVRVAAAVPVGNGGHLRLTLEQDGVSFQAMLFGVGPQAFPLEVGERADCAVALSVNRYGGVERPQARVVSIRPHGFDMAAKLRLGAAYQGLLRGEGPGGCREELSLGREELGVVFRWLRGHSPWQKGVDALSHRLGSASNYGRVLAALDILKELGLVERKTERGVETIRVLPAAGKADLSASRTYRMLQPEFS